MSDLRHRVSVSSPSSTPDGLGGYSESYAAATPATVWASIQPATPAVIERVVGNGLEAKVSHVVTVRYHAGITTKTRLTYGSRLLDVRGVQDIREHGEWLVLACEEVKA